MTARADDPNDRGDDDNPHPGPESGEVHAAIDIGTNSIHLVVGRVDDHGGFEVLTTDKESVRLGENPGPRGELDEAAIERGVSTLERFKQVASTYNADIVAVATSAVREAPNRSDFIERAATEAGIAVDVIAGTEEARLIHLGVLQALPIYNDRSLVIDIGGGSTELVVGQSGEMLSARSVKVGHIRLTNQFFPGGLVTPAAVADCRAYLRAFLVPATQATRKLDFDVSAGSSGTITTIANLTARMRGADADARVGDPNVITVDGLHDLVELLISTETVEDRLEAVAGLEHRRADVIVAGALLLQELFDQLGIEQMTVSDFALREGVILDRLHGEDAGVHQLSDIRRQSVLRFADSFEEDRSHVEHATELALQMFDALQDLHRFSEFERDLLEAAGLLHNVGLFISHAAHHKHSYYVIRNSDRLNGFTDHEIELIAQVARYHRRSGPKPTHMPFTRLRENDQRRVKVLSGILRIAIALDRTRSRAVQFVGASVSDHIKIIAAVKEGADASLELYTARERCHLLASALDLPVEIDAAGEITA